jgi:4-amino-4-deoxy-L-arabinose transferase-like glycosyltransferase
MAHSLTASPERTSTAATLWANLVRAAAIFALLFLVFYNLAEWPLTWFDEGSHLHVPKTLVRYGVYADYSSEGFRHYGPTIGVGPTVMLPVAAAFQLFGIGLLQARVVMALFLLAAVAAFFALARTLGNASVAWAATALLVATRALSLLEFGRQVLGEVPGLFFMLAGLAVWFAAWERAGWGRLIGAGVLLGLAMVTKQQYLLVLGPALLAAWMLNLIWHRSAPQKVFLAPGIVSGVCFALWQAVLIVALGPATTADNLAQYRAFTSGAALVFSIDLMQRALIELIRPSVFVWLLFPALIYGVKLSLPRTAHGHRWATLFALVLWNLAWYIVASVSWIRYAFPALAMASLFIAQWVYDWSGGFRVDWGAARRLSVPALARLGLLLWAVFAIIGPVALTAREIIQPPANAPRAMADYMNAHVPPTDVVETWEPEMGFLTDHNYHFPPQILLNTAVKYIWQNGAPPAAEYDFVQTASPRYVLVGNFSRWVQLYPEALSADYHLETEIGGYQLYARTAR